MRGFVWLPIALFGSLILTSFSLFINSNNLSGLMGSANALATEVSGLRVPFDIDYSVSKYSDDKDNLYKDTLKSAWENARLAMVAAKDIQTIAAGAKLVVIDNQTILNVDFNIYSREAEVRAYLEKALNDAYFTLQGLVNLLDYDRDRLDLLGADDQNFSKSQVFGALTGFLDSVNSETGNYNQLTRIEANPCAIDELKYRTICVIHQMAMRQQPTIVQAVSIFNQIVGYPGQSFLQDYFEYHKNLTNLMLQMHNDYEDTLTIFDQKVYEIDGKIEELEKDGVLLINSGVMGSVTGKSNGSIQLSAGYRGSLSEKFIYSKQDLSEMMVEEYSAERVFGQEQDDYLFDATELTRELNFRLSDLSLALDSLAGSMSELRDMAEQVYDRLLRENEGKKTSALYLDALELGGKARNGNIGESITGYSQAIGYLVFMASSPDSVLALDQSLKYLGKTIEALDGFGIDVSYEKEQYDRLAKITDQNLSAQVFASVQQLTSKLSDKASYGVSRVRYLAERLAGYFADYHSFLGEPIIAQKLDKKKIDELEKYFENSLTYDPLSNLDELYKKYMDINDYLESEFGSIASDYLSKYISYSYDFFDSPSCLNYSRGRVLLSVRNPASVAFSNVTIARNLSIATDLDNPLVFAIDRIGPGEIKYREYPANIFYDCSDYQPNKTQLDKRLFDASNRISQLCLFRDCSDLKKIYREAYSQSEPTLVEEALSVEIDSFLRDFTGKETKAKLDRLELSLKDFDKAVDGKVSFEHNVTLVFSSADYSQAYSEYKRLKSMYDLLTPVSFSSKPAQDRFGELVDKFSPADLIGFFDDLGSLETYVNSSIGSIRNEAKASLLLAKQNAEENKANFSSLKKALDYYNSGSYNKAILFASQVPEKTESGFDFTYIVYASLAVILALFCLFLIRKPKNERKIVRRLLRSD
jgi:hypothetical protein